MIDYRYMLVFIVYSVAMLVIGYFAAGRVRSMDDFVLAGRSLGPVLAAGTFIATFVSAMTVVGGVGYCSQFGWSYVTYIGIPITLAWMILILIGPTMRRSGYSSIPGLFWGKYHDRKLQILSAGLIVFIYSLFLITQLFGVSAILVTAVGLSRLFWITIVGLVFVAYTAMGGLIAVARTDLVQAALMFVGVFAAVVSILPELAARGISFVSQAKLNGIFSGMTKTPLDILNWTLVMSLGTAVHPYYVHRMFAVKDDRTARNMIGYGALFLVPFFLSIMVIGIAAGLLAPDKAGDAAFPHVLKNVLNPTVGGVILCGLISAIMSTTDSLLHVVGSYIATGIYGALYPEASDKQLLKAAQIATIVFGLGTTLLAGRMALGPIPLVAVFSGYAATVLTCTLFVPIFSAYFWTSATRQGVTASMIVGFASAIIFTDLFNKKVVSINPTIIGLALSVLVLWLVSKATAPRSEPGV